MTTISIFKTSNHSPNLTELDLNENNEFSCQVNTSGESVKSYKLKILSKNGDETIYNPDEPTKLNVPVKNKKFLTINNINKDTHDVGKVFKNGSDYQWGIRVYNQDPGSAEQPNTSVCDGYLVGSTKNVVWSRVPENETLRELLNDFFLNSTRYSVENIDTVFSDYGIVVRKQIQKLKDDIVNGVITSSEQKTERINNIVVDQNNSTLDQVVYDRYIEFKIPEGEKSNLIIGAKDDPSKKLPLNYPYTKRLKIDWVEKNLGTDEDIMKIETKDEFEYNYADGTEYKIYQCSNEHTVNSFFSDPNSNLNTADYIVIYNTIEDATAARNEGEDPSTPTPKVIPVFKSRKIVGYSSDTGEVRVSDSFEYAPLNGMVYRAFKYDAIADKYTEIEPSIGNVYSKQNVPYYNISGTLADGAKYYTNEACTQNEATIKDGKTTKFTFDNTGYSHFGSGSSIRYFPTPASYKLPTQTEYYKNREKTQYAGMIGYVYNMIDDHVSTVTDKSVKYYIATPTTNRITKGTVFYTDIDLTTPGGVYGADYTLYSEEYSNVKINGTTYKIATPKKGKIARGTPVFNDKNLAADKLCGVYGVDYQLEDDEKAKVYINGKTYYIRVNRRDTEDTDAHIQKTVKAGTIYYNDADLEESHKEGILTEDKTYTLVNITHSTITVDGTTRYIATPLTGEAISDTSGKNINFYSDLECTEKVGEILSYNNVEYTFGNTYYSTVTIGSDTGYVKTPSQGEVDTSTGDVSYYLDDVKGTSVGVIKSYTGLTYTMVNNNYSRASTSTTGSPQYIVTPSSNYVPYNTQYYKDEGLQESAGYFRNIEIDFYYTDYNYAFFIVNTTTYYCNIPGADNSYITFDTPYYTTNQLDIKGASPEGYITNDVKYSFKKFLSGTYGSYTINLGENTYYTKVTSPSNTGANYYDASYAGIYTDSGSDIKYYTIKIGENNYYIKEADTESSGTSKEFYESQTIGGTPITDSRFRVLSNRWDLSTKRLFIQPNNNIKTDYTNPDELVFTSGNNSKVRIDINKVEKYNRDTGKYIDITINKLDNTQWLLEGDSLQLVEGSLPPGTIFPETIPQTDYTIYTCFMDSLPFNVFYARSTPNIDIMFKNLDGDSEYNDITKTSVRVGAKYYSRSDLGEYTYVGETEERISSEPFDENYHTVKIDGIKYYVKIKENDVLNVEQFFSFRDVKFKTIWESVDDTVLPQVKYYKYTLYSMDDRLQVEIQNSGDKYNTELEWTFRGLDGADDSSHSRNVPHPYKIRVEICDEYNRVYSKEKEFGIFYVTETGSNTLDVGDNEFTNYLCEENCMNVIINAPTIIGTFDTYTEGEQPGSKEKYERTVNVLVDDIRLDLTTDTYPEEFNYKDTIYYTPEHNPVKNKILEIKEKEILNYSKAYNVDGEIIPYDLPVTLGTYMELQLTENFITKIKPGEDRILLAVSHNTNDTIIRNDSEYPYHLTENFYFKVHSFSPYVYKYETYVGDYTICNQAIVGKYRMVQDDKAYLASLWKRDYYGNETQVNGAFIDSLGNGHDYFDLSTQGPADKSSVNYSLRFALQRSSKYQIFESWNEVVEDNLDPDKKLVVLLNTKRGEQVKYAGIYEYNTISKRWTVIEEEEYQFLNSISQFSYHEQDTDEYIYYSISGRTEYYSDPGLTTKAGEITGTHDIERVENNYILKIDNVNYYVKPSDAIGITFYVDEDLIKNGVLQFDTGGEESADPYIWMDDSMYTIKQQKIKVLTSKIMRFYLKIDNTTSDQDENDSETTNEKVICQITFDQA